MSVSMKYAVRSSYPCLCFFFSQRRECGGCFPGGGEKDLPEHSGRQPGPERGRIRGPAQAVCPAGRQANQRSTASEGSMWLLMTNTTHSTFSSLFTSPSSSSSITPPGLVLSQLAGGCEQGPTNGGNYTQTRLFVRDSPPLHHFLFHLITALSFSFPHALPEYRPISDTRQRCEKHDGGVMVFNQRSVASVDTTNVQKASIGTEIDSETVLTVIPVLRIRRYVHTSSRIPSD